LFNSSIREKQDIETARKILTEQPCLLNSIDSDEWSIIHHCARIGNAKILRMLIEEFKADINARTAYNYTPAIIAAQYDNKQCLIELINLGANFENEDRSGRKPVDYLIEKKNDMKVLEKYMDISFSLVYEENQLKIIGECENNKERTKYFIEIELN
jgi:ankyrin repeat protein